MQQANYTLQELPIDQIERDPKHPRHTDETFDEHNPLLISIGKFGLLDPIAVCPTEEGNYLIIDGNRRFQCVRKLKWQVVPCLVHMPLNQGEIQTLRYIRNNDSKDWTAKERKEVEKRIKTHEDTKDRDGVDTIIDAARVYQTTAHELMERLAEHLGAPLNTFAEDAMAGENYPPSGDMDSEWQYTFHGLECGFQNSVTGQIVEVQLGFGEFGVLDPYFFFLFVRSTRTTPKLEKLVQSFQDSYSDMHLFLTALESCGKLQQIRDVPRDRYGWTVIPQKQKRKLQ